MPCYRPILAYVTNTPNDNGKKNIVFQKPQSYRENINLPCGQCIGCKLSHSRQWATRCEHEISLHENNCFITLTYDDKHLPQNQSLYKPDFQDFLKRFRKSIEPHKISYFMCGEYGDITWRPHYHAIIFNYDFPDKVQIQEADVENPYHISPLLTKLWPKGQHIIATANYETAAYVARYCLKKITGDSAESHYNRILTDWNEITGEITEYQEVQLEPEYANMSTNPAIGKNWIKKFKNDCYPSDYLIKDGHKIPIPSYYDKELEKADQYLFETQKTRRRINSALADKITLERLHKIESIKKLQIKSLMRNKQ